MARRNDYGIQEEALSNGFKIIFKKMPISEICACLMVKCGSVYEPPEVNGVSHLLEHMVAEDDLIRDKRQRPLYKIERFGADMEARTSEIDTSFELFAPREYGMHCLRLFLNSIALLRFSEKSFLKERAVVLQETNEADENLYDKIIKRLFKGHPLSRPVRGSKKSVSHISSRALRRWHKKLYQPQYMTLFVVGDTTMSNIKRSISKSEIKNLENSSKYIIEPAMADFNWQADTTIPTEDASAIYFFPGPPYYECEKNYYYRVIYNFFDDRSVFSLWWNVLRSLNLYSGIETGDEGITTFSNFANLELRANSKKLLKQIQHRLNIWLRRIAEDGFSNAIFSRIKRQSLTKLERDRHCGHWWVRFLEDAFVEKRLAPEKIDIYLNPSHLKKKKLDEIFREYFGKMMIFRSF